MAVFMASGRDFLLKSEKNSTRATAHVLFFWYLSSPNVLLEPLQSETAIIIPLVFGKGFVLLISEDVRGEAYT